MIYKSFPEKNPKTYISIKSMSQDLEAPLGKLCAEILSSPRGTLNVASWGI